MPRVDLHVHTVCSGDAVNRLCHIATALKKVDAVAICDHNEIACALKARRLLGPRVIVGTEIDTGEGELLGLFLSDRVAAGLGLRRTADAIRSQGGLVIAPHPFDTRRKGAGVALIRILDALDAVEVLNARTAGAAASTQALRFAEEHGLAAVAGSDAHVPGEIGLAATLLDEVPRNAEQARRLLKKSRPAGRNITFLERVYARVRRTLRL